MRCLPRAVRSGQQHGAGAALGRSVAHAGHGGLKAHAAARRGATTSAVRVMSAKNAEMVCASRKMAAQRACQAHTGRHRGLHDLAEANFDGGTCAHRGYFDGPLAQ